LTSFEKLDTGKLAGLSIATCCHHRCDIITYVNLDFITEQLDIPLEMFESFVRCSSWAVSPLTGIRKRRAGFKVKRMLDFGRLLYIRDKCGLKNSAGVQYCNWQTESPESTLIICSP